MAERLVIIGGGFAGLRVLFGLKGLEGLEIALVDSRDTSLVKPSLPEVAFSGKPVDHVRFPLDRVTKRAGVRFVRSVTERIAIDDNQVVLGTGERLDYDYLLIATGAHKDYDAIPGYREHGHSVCDDAEAPRLARAVEEFDGGPVVIGSARSEWGTRVETPKLGAPCEGPVGEIMFMLDAELRRRKIRDRSSISVFSPGDEFFEDVGPEVHAALGPAISEAGIEVATAKLITGIGPGEVTFADGDSWPSHLTVLIPPYRGPGYVFASAGLGDEKGFIPTDHEMRHLDHPNVFAAGDGTALASPKLGHIAIHQADIATASLRREITGDGEIPEYRPEIFCIMNRGGHEATLILSNHLYGGDIDRAFSSPIAHAMKWGFDSWYYYTRGHMPPELSQKALLEILESSWIEKL